MSSTKKVFLALLVSISILYILLLFVVDILNSFNVYGRIFRCESKLKVISEAMNLYQADWDGQWPESLEAMKKYYPYNRIPVCPGNRNEQETNDYQSYYYFKPKVEECVPVCWDSNPHYNIRRNLIPDTKKWNVLFSDGHIEELNEKELFGELSQLSKTNPDVLKVLNLLNEKE